MKVLVMSEEQAASHIQGYKDVLEMEITLGTYDAEEIGAMKLRLAAVQALRAAMTEIDIPDGCMLAVVPQLWSQPINGIEYRRLIQEVKL